MKIEYHFNSDNSLKDISFLGLTGSECCHTVKDALSEDKLSIENPAKSFAYKLKSGGYDGISDKYIERDAAVANFLCEYLWRYDCKDDCIGSINVLQLLANSIRLNVILWQKLTKVTK